MQRFSLNFYATASGLTFFNLALRALHDPKVSERYEYSIEYGIADTDSPNGISHKVTWWRKQTGEQR